MPKIFNFETRVTIIFDFFDSWRFVFVNPIYQFPRTLPFVRDLLNFEVEE